MTDEWYANTKFQFRWEFKDKDGALIDPDSTRLDAWVVDRKLGTSTQKYDNNTDSSKESTGVWYWDITLDVAGLWLFKVRGGYGSYYTTEWTELEVLDKEPS